MEAQNLLTFRPGHSDNELCPYAYGTGREKLDTIPGASSAIRRRFFVPAAISMAAGRRAPSGGLVPWFRLLTPTVSPPPNAVRSVGDGFQPNQESNMPNDKTPGASVAITFKYITLDSAVKRTRRHLAKSGSTLIKSKPGTKAWAELGDFAIKDASGELLMKSVNLRSLMQAAGILADDEMIELPGFSGWRWYAARQIAVKHEGKTVLVNEPLSRVYFSEKQARRAAERIADKAGLVICSFDASGRSGGRNE